MFPITCRIIYQYQRKDKELLDRLKCANYQTKYFCGGGIFTQIICKDNEIVIPKIFQKYDVNWYYMYLLNPGIDRTEAYISQHNFCPKSWDDICTQIKVWKTCQRNKKKGLKCG